MNRTGTSLLTVACFVVTGAGGLAAADVYEDPRGGFAVPATPRVATRAGAGVRDDNEAALRYLLERPEIDEARIGLLGHSEGGVIAYDGDEVVGWAAVARRSETSFARSRSIPKVDDLDVWSVWCIRVRPGYRGRGISYPLLAGAVEYARSQGAPAIEGYPLDNRGEKIDTTMAYVGTRALFEKTEFHRAADTTSVLCGILRVLMRHDLE